MGRINYRRRGVVSIILVIMLIYMMPVSIAAQSSTKVNLYNPYVDKDIVTEVPSGIFSNWFMNEINGVANARILYYDDYAAIKDGFINPKGPATREEFATMISRMLQSKIAVDLYNEPYSYGYNAVLDYFNLQYQESPFIDTLSDDVALVAQIGITNGVGGNKFSPEGTLTREQAAVMLARAARALGIQPVSGSGTNYSDLKKASSWAKDDIVYLSRIKGLDGKAIMGGIGNNQFDPKGSYTYEQALATAVRLYNCQIKSVGSEL